MDKDSLKKILEKKPEGPIDRYMHEKDLSDKYGNEGIRIYLLMDGQTSAEEIMKKVGVEENRFIEIINYIESNGMLETGEPVSKPAEVPAPPPKPREEPVKPVEEFPLAKPKLEVPSIPLVKTEDVNFKEEETPKVNELPLEKPKEEIPSIPLLKTEGIVEAEEKSSALKALVTSEKPTEEPAQPAPRQKAYGKPRIPKTPLEKKLYAKFGDDGLYAYSLIDEFKTPREIVKQSGMSEERLKEIIGFMKDEGIIKLERPLIAPVEAILAEEKPTPEKPQVQPPKQVTPYRAPTIIIPLQPKSAPAQAKPAETSAPSKPVVAQPVKQVEKPEPKALKPLPLNREEICVPTAVPMKLVNKLRLEGELLRRYGNEGSKVLSHMNGKKVNVKIMKELRMSPAKFDEIASFLLDGGAIKIQCLTPDNVRELYGEEGLSIYNKYGRDGILLYEFIDKKSSLKDIVKMSGIEPRLAVEIFAFIHKVLGLDIPIDTELLYKQLGIKP